MNAKVLIAAAILLGSLVAAHARPNAQASTPLKSVRTGVYTDVQAKRGFTLYGDQCIGCHGDDLMGLDDAKPLVGADFLSNWNGQTVGALVDETAKSMPKDNPNGLTRQEYVDLVAYLLQVNHFPAGQTELPLAADQLNQLRIDPAPSDTPKTP